MNRDYIPGTDGELYTWTENFEQKLPGYIKELSVGDDDAREMILACQNIRGAIQQNNADQSTAHKSREAKDAILSENEKLLRNDIQRLKKSKGFTAAIGKDLNINMDSSAFNRVSYKTTLTATAYPGFVEIAFTKKGVDGINIYSRQAGGNNWVKLALDLHSPYIDNRPLTVENEAETREYMGIGVVNDAETGQASNIVSIVFGG